MLRHDFLEYSLVVAEEKEKRALHDLPEEDLSADHACAALGQS